MSPVALVTGSGKRRVGWYVAQALGQRGYRLAIHYHNSAAAANDTVAQFKSAGVDAAVFQADISDEHAVTRLIREVHTTFGRLDVLVNCAAVWQAKPLEDITAADLRENFDINALGTFLCTQQAGLMMVKQPEGGCIINMGDWAEIRPYLHYAAYFPSKGAVTAITRCLAVELGSRNPRVRVNCILPGPVMFSTDISEEEKRQAIKGTLVKHEGSPGNVAQAVLALIDNEFITGVCLPVDGGRSIYAAE